MIDENDSEDESNVDSDVELQEAFARGELKPGLVVLEKNDKTRPEKPAVINNVPRLKSLLQQMQLPASFSWVEKLDVINDLAPLAPEIAVQLDDHRERREKAINVVNLRKKKKGSNIRPTLTAIEDDPIHNDFKRELNFHRQAQSAIMICLPRLKSLGVPTKRPEDYFAEMAKSDSHMQKVASVLLKKQTATEKAEKVRKMRDQKKISKQTQVQVLQERQKAKKEMIDNVKKYRKGQKNSLDFLEERKSSGKKEPRVNKKRDMKNERYGYGGQKKGVKQNTRESLDNIPDRGFRGGRGGRGGGGRMGNINRGTRGGGGVGRGDFGSRGGMSRGGGGGGMSRGGGGGGMFRGGGRGGMSRGGGGGGMSRGGGRGGVSRGGGGGGMSRGGGRGGMSRGGGGGGMSRGGGGMFRGGGGGGMSRGGGRGGMSRGGGRDGRSGGGKTKRPGKSNRMKLKSHS